MNNEIQSIYNMPIGSQCEHDGLILTLTEEGWRAEVKHTMMRRCRDWDYCKPWTYLVTIGCQHHDVAPQPLEVSAAWRYPQWLREVYARSGRPHLFGELVGNTAEEAAIALTPFGKAVEEAIMSIPAHYPQVRIIEKVVMPNHIHFVIRIKERLPEKQPLGFIINKFKSWVNRSYKAICLGLPQETAMDLSYQQAGAGSKGAQAGAGAAPQQGAAPSSSPTAVPSSQSGSVPSSAPMAQSTKRHGTHPKIGLVFEPGFHDRILFREGQLQRMIEYCRDNPRRLWKVRNNSRFFHAVSGIRLVMPLLAVSGTKGRNRWMGPVEGLIAPISYSASEHPASRHDSSVQPAPSQPNGVTPALPHDGSPQPALPHDGSAQPAPPQPNGVQPALPHDGSAQPAPPQPNGVQPALPHDGSAQPASPQPNGAQPALPHDGSAQPAPPQPNGVAPYQVVTFTAIGNVALLKAPERMQIQCSRSMSDAEIEAMKQEVLEACRHGVVPISPCISPGERMIARAVMDEGFSLIALFPQGIPEDTAYKPYKEYFEACAEGQLLLMSPWRFEYGKTHLARWQCLFLNDIAMQLMVGMNMLAE